ncbi:MAG: hypothetical protein AAFU85_28205, partial [Planctomycetota bacterium]
IARALVRDSIAGYGWNSQIGKVRFGWITPLSVDEIQLVGASGETQLQIGRLDSSLTLPQLIGFDASHLGEITLRGVSLTSTVSAGSTSLEEDLRQLLEGPDQEQSQLSAKVSIQDAKASFSDKETQRTWEIDQSNIDCEIIGEAIRAKLAGVIVEPAGGGGAIEANFAWLSGRSDSNPVSLSDGDAAPTDEGWELSIQTDSLPLSTMDLIARRFDGEISGLPVEYTGDATGSVRMIGGANGSFQAAIENLRVRNLATIGGVTAGWNNNESGQWTNSMATLDGKLSLNNGWLFGYGLTATTDFGGATIDGAFPTHVTLTGQGDNPVKWLQAFDGKAHMDIDLAALDRALPGFIPLRADAKLVSGRAIGTIENVRSSAGGRQSRLQMASESLRARSGGRAVIIEPIELTAIVSGDGGELQAESFELNSAFAQASGKGSLRSGAADVKVDFGRLYTMLRPIVDLSDLSLGGMAGGRVQWKVTPAVSGTGDQWALSGSGEGKNLLITLPDGNRFKRSVVRTELKAVGHWNGQTLDELSMGEAVVHSGGVYAKAELTRPVKNPSETSIYPLRLSGDGRMENLSESLRPWLPTAMQDAEGRVMWAADAEVGRQRLVVSQVQMELFEPRVVISDQWYSQPQLKVDFTGTVAWPSGNLYSEEFTVRGDALSLAVRGEASRETTNLDVAWKADLERLQASLGTRFAAAQASMHSASYRPTSEPSYRVTGRCEGKATITDVGDQWKVEVNDASAANLRLTQIAGRLAPPGTPEGINGPSGQPTFGQSFGVTGNQPTEVWSEPALKLNGPLLIAKRMDSITLDGVRIVSDWMEGMLSGNVVSREDQFLMQVHGPTRWNMNEVGRRLAQLSGTAIFADGMHETELQVRLRSGGDQPTLVEASGDLGWTSCQLGDVWLGRATLPFRMTERQLTIAQSTFPVAPAVGANGPGQVNDLGMATVSAELTYATSDQPTLLRLGSGSRVESLSITREMAAGWLQYLAPLAAGSASVDGKLGAEFDEALIVVEDPASSRVRGRLRIDHARLATGPMAQQLLLGVQQLKSLARAGEPSAPSQATLMTMPAQLVDFQLENGVVTHQRMLFQIDRAQLLTSGSVDFQTRLDLMAQLPLDASWLGSDLKGLAGQSVTFPVRGTLSQPALDSSAIREIVTRLGTQAGAEVIQNRLEGIMQKQLGSGLEQINSGLEKILGF